MNEIKMNEMLNAKITGTTLGESHGYLTAYIALEGDAWGCSYGGYVLDRWCAEPGRYKSRDGYGAIVELMKTVGVESWEELRGKYVRIKLDSSDAVVAIGNLLKDQWFSFKEYFEEIRNGERVK